MHAPLDRPLLLADDVAFSCKSCGDCCRSEWLIGVDEAAWRRLAAVDWHRLDPALPAADKFALLPEPLPGGETRTFARITTGPSRGLGPAGPACGSCVFLTEDSRCAIHRHLGYHAKPQVCREFPYVFTDTPDGVAVGLSFACTAVRGRHGAPLAEQEADVREILAGSTRVRRVLPRPEEPERPADASTLWLYSGLDITWADYRPIERALLAILARTDQPAARCLIAGSVLIALCVSLAEVERKARAAGQTPPRTIASALPELAADDHARLFAVAASARAPSRPSLAHLAPLFAWLRLSRQHLGRFTLVAQLYADYFRFRRQRGRVPDLVTDGGAVDLAGVARVRFTATPETDAFLRGYWRHVVFRKTLTPAHGVFRGYHLLLALHSFTRWAARDVAHRAGRGQTTIEDVQEAVRVVEQRFVLHTRFGDVFSVSPVLTLLADRLFASRGFVSAAVLDPADRS